MIYPSAGGRPKARRMLTDRDPAQQHLFDLFGLAPYAPALRSYKQPPPNRPTASTNTKSDQESQETRASSPGLTAANRRTGLMALTHATPQARARPQAVYGAAYDRPPTVRLTASAASRTGRYGAGWPGRWARSWHAWRTGTPARLAAARM